MRYTKVIYKIYIDGLKTPMTEEAEFTHRHQTNARIQEVMRSGIFDVAKTGDGVTTWYPPNKIKKIEYRFEDVDE